MAHPAAELFPLLDDAALAPLVDSMKRHGFDPAKPILVYGAAILDGRNRKRAAELAGVTPVYLDVTDSCEDPWFESWKQNGARRDLPADQKAAIYVKVLESSARWQSHREAAMAMANAARAEAAKEQHATSKPWSGESRDGRASREARPSGDRHVASRAVAAEAGVSRATLDRVVELKRKAPDRFEAVARGEARAAKELRNLKSEHLGGEADPPIVRGWDAEEFLSDVRSQIDEWRGEWLKHEPHLSRLVIEIRLNNGMLEKEDARIRQGES